MGLLTKQNGSAWPKLVQDFFGTENPFDLDEKFWLPEKGVEIPSTNVIENDKEFKLELSAPGFDKKDFKVEVVDGMLNISAEKEDKKEEKKENPPKSEHKIQMPVIGSPDFHYNIQIHLHNYYASLL